MHIPKIIAFYFPQFHAIKENDEWWGEGFTDWKLVKETKPLFEGHNQPRVPIDENYYNPCNKETLKEQALLAKKYGVEGFMFYHYWFDGKLYLEKPMEVFLSNPDIDISFCVTWANESWTRSWIGKPEVFLQKQLHTNDKSIWENHFNYLLPFFKDKRAIKIDNKPVFLIYQPFLINNSKEMLEYWQELAIQNGLDGLYIIAVKNHDYQTSSFLTSYDAIMKFQPREAYASKDFQDQNISARFQFLRRLPHIVQLYLTKLNQKISSYKIFSANKVWNIILKNSYINEFKEYNLKVFESAFFEWDNSPRYKKKAKLFTGLTDEQKKSNLKELIKGAIKNETPYVFFNAWNEWSESAYLEPDKENGYKHLEIIKEVIDDLKKENEA
ncbi:glycoside hydrolase family 99-like domain-containing protein [Flavobacterium sp. '19STA2R22 D10 B1']|uniref:glycosyltransferase WbsX family protein n=1 Tax=Flavobacterium aerium TaxID=3037261 RepID=UPI00278C3A4A|nr:glycoside hydrolase family 99-like domain-containing protein [Flavobacterium sp. '19STA2R22 D10 B1']